MKNLKLLTYFLFAALSTGQLFSVQVELSTKEQDLLTFLVGLKECIYEVGQYEVGQNDPLSFYFSTDTRFRNFDSIDKYLEHLIISRQKTNLEIKFFTTVEKSGEFGDYAESKDINNSGTQKNDLAYSFYSQNRHLVSSINLKVINFSAQTISRRNGNEKSKCGVIKTESPINFEFLKEPIWKKDYFILSTAGILALFGLTFFYKELKKLKKNQALKKAKEKNKKKAEEKI